MKKISVLLLVLLLVFASFGSAVMAAQTAITPAATAIYYVALGDSIATGSTSRGKTTSHVTKYYNYLVTQNPGTSVTCKNLAADGEDSTTLLTKLTGTTTTALTVQAEVKKATVLTISIGGNNVMNAARSSYFAKIDATLAKSGTDRFVAEYPKILARIRVLNSTAKIIALTLYNPYNSIAIRYYESDVQLHNTADTYINQINAMIKVSGTSYSFAEINSLWETNYAAKGTMGSITYFYPNFLIKFTRDPHPNQTGQNLILEQLKLK